MPYLSPPTLTTAEQLAVLRAMAGNVRDHVIISLALGTGLRLAEIVGLNVRDVFTPNGTPRTRVRVRKQIAKGGRAADVFLPDRLVPKLRKLWRLKKARATTSRRRRRCSATSQARGSRSGGSNARGRSGNGWPGLTGCTPFIACATAR